MSFQLLASPLLVYIGLKENHRKWVDYKDFDVLILRKFNDLKLTKSVDGVQ